MSWDTLLRFRDSQAHSTLRHPAREFLMCSEQAARGLARGLHRGTCRRHSVAVGVAAKNATTGCFGVPLDNLMEMTMKWTTPSYTDMRLGFEITMYIATR